MPARYCYLTETARLANDWPMGTGLLLLPASWAGTTWAHAWVVLLAAAAMAVWWRYNPDYKSNRIIALAAMVVGTPVLFYLAFGPFFSHIASFTLVTVFLTHWSATPAERRIPYQWLMSGLLLGLSALVRPQNALLGLIYLADLPAIIRLARAQQIKPVVNSICALAAGTILGISPRLPAYAVVYGHPFQLPKLEEMNWFSPNIIDTLFNDYHGVLPWTPLLFLAVAGLVTGLWQKPRVAAGLLLVFMVQVYVNAANEVWWSGGSFGNRRLTDYSIVVAYGICFLTSYPSRLVRVPVLATTLLCSAWTLTLLLAERRLILPLDRYIPFHYPQLPISLSQVFTQPVATWQALSRGLSLPTALQRALASVALFAGMFGVIKLARSGQPRGRGAAAYTLVGCTVVLLVLSTVAAVRTPAIPRDQLTGKLPKGSTILWDNYLELCGYYMVRGEFAKAIASADKAIAILPEEPGGYWYKALAHLNNNQWEDARKSADKVLALNPDHVNARALLSELNGPAENQPATNAGATTPSSDWRIK